MYDLLSVVVEWAEEADVRVNDVVWRKAQAVLADGPTGTAVYIRANRAVTELFERGFETPVLTSCKPCCSQLKFDAAGGSVQLDRPGAAYIRDCVLRRILVDSPPHVLWAVTGSSMGMLWMSMAAMPVNGTAPLNQLWQVHLPGSVPPRLMQELAVHSPWQLGLSQQQLQELEQPQEMVDHQQQAVGQEQHRKDQERQGQPQLLPQRLGWVQTLQERSGNSPALFTTMVKEWAFSPRSQSIGAFVDEFLNTKLVAEAVKEWKLGVGHMDDEGRRRVLDLSDVVLGGQVDDIMDRGLWLFLKPHLQEVELGGRYCLADPMQRQLLRAVIDPGGKLRERFIGAGPSGPGASTSDPGAVASKSKPNRGSALSVPSAGGSSGAHASAPKAGATADSTAAGAIARNDGSATASATSAATGASVPSAPSAGIGIDGASSASAPSASTSSASSADSTLTGSHASVSSPRAPNNGASAPSAGGTGASDERGRRRRSRPKKHRGGGAGGSGADPVGSGGGAPAIAGGRGRPGSSGSRAHTGLRSSGASAAARVGFGGGGVGGGPLLAGKALVPHTRAMLTAPAAAVRRLNLMRVTTTAPAAFRFS
ncbi:hypothetical protein HYH02_007899 [Chlamydomonas schloesseri]|uniref:Uncharacterized protein n=1 Tax=Chlamydomonas schloesseri TaxID=2026947 RepID=A0A835WGZ3_9CHLO|nr:hypothetical protein HYH02_007899 [Chlamydomonas schloesseri]|eukprot:KAG2447153.1 hypothetical protein HYH02_007899 [Chlamydomonas schloesseri]